MFLARAIIISIANLSGSVCVANLYEPKAIMCGSYLPLVASVLKTQASSNRLCATCSYMLYLCAPWNRGFVMYNIQFRQLQTFNPYSSVSTDISTNWVHVSKHEFYHLWVKITTECIMLSTKSFAHWKWLWVTSMVHWAIIISFTVMFYARVLSTSGISPL